MAHKKLGAQTKGTGRAAMQFGGVAPVDGGGVAPVGGVGTARRDMRSGYYPDDMGMRGGPMYEKGGRVGLRSRTFKKGGTVKKAKGGRAGLRHGNLARGLKKVASAWQARKEKKRLSAEERELRPTGLGAAKGGRAAFAHGMGADKKAIKKILKPKGVFKPKKKYRPTPHAHYFFQQ